MRHIRIPFLVVVLSLMLTGMAFAVDIPDISTWTQSVPGGKGDLLLAPLYDVRALTNPDTPEGTSLITTQQTLIAIVNTDPTYGVIAHIRFREWKRSDEVLDFSIPLSANDVWVGEVSRQNGGGAIINSPDRWIYGTVTSASFPTAVFPTAGVTFSGTAAQNEYGYIEIIGEERVSTFSTTTSAWSRLTPTDKDVKDTLMGHVYLIRPEAQVSHQYNMNAFSDFSRDTDGIWDSPYSGHPNLYDDGNFNQLEAIMSKRIINFQYVDGIDTDTNTPMSTSVVITFPTKHYHYGTTYKYISAAGWAPFTGYYETLGDGTSYGEVFKSYVYDRAENTFVYPVSPGELEILPYEVNIMGLLPEYPLPTPASRGWRDNILLGTKNQFGTTYQSGWVKLDLSPTTADVGALDTRTAAQGKSWVTGFIFSFFDKYYYEYQGLPAIGIVMTEFYNDSAEGYYGNTVPWQYEVRFGEAPTL